MVYKKLKWFIQRGKRGYADCDWWDMADYLIWIIVPMLKELKKHQHGYPNKASTPEKWDTILDQMIEGFEAGERILTDDCPSVADQEIFNNGMKLFSEWFFDLWD